MNCSLCHGNVDIEAVTYSVGSDPTLYAGFAHRYCVEVNMDTKKCPPSYTELEERLSAVSELNESIRAKVVDLQDRNKELADLLKVVLARVEAKMWRPLDCDPPLGGPDPFPGHIRQALDK